MIFDNWFMLSARVFVTLTLSKIYKMFQLCNITVITRFLLLDLRLFIATCWLVVRVVTRRCTNELL